MARSVAALARLVTVIEPLQVGVIRLLVARPAAVRQTGDRHGDNFNCSASTIRREMVSWSTNTSFEVRVERLRPHVVAGRNVHQPDVDAHPPAGSLDAAVEQILDAQLLSRLPRIDLLVLVTKDRRAGDDREARCAARPVMSESVMPSVKYSSCGLVLRFVSGSAAIDLECRSSALSRPDPAPPAPESAARGRTESRWRATANMQIRRRLGAERLTNRAPAQARTAPRDRTRCPRRLKPMRRVFFKTVPDDLHQRRRHIRSSGARSFRRGHRIARQNRAHALG